MQNQFDNSLVSSFYLWFDNRICNKLQAFSTGQTQSFTYYSGNDTPLGYNYFYTDNNQLCADSTLVTGGSGITINGTGFNQNTTGTIKILIDNHHSRILISNNVPTGSTISGSFLEKEVNVYPTNESEEDILLNKSFVIASGIKYLESIEDVGRRRYMLPCCFLLNDKSKNDPFALGGLKDTKSSFKATVFADNQYQLDAILSTFRDTKHTCFKIIDTDNFPYGRYWNIKNYPYKYGDYVEANSIDDCFIEDVGVYKLKEKFPKIRKDTFIGFIEFDISTVRMTN